MNAQKERADIIGKLKYLACMCQKGSISGAEAEKAMNREIDDYLNQFTDAEVRAEEEQKNHRTKWRLLLQATNEHGKPIRSKVMEDWIVFRHGDKELCSISVRGTFPGEIRSTKELLAYENGIRPEDITHTIERR